ncbi:unnamed protein product [Amoebophrya sp. A120]|nr:unnamed protein product [Amoebophrya sp. A120]|eukprot:GSA120T00026403001.1
MYSAPLLADISSHGRDSHSDTFSFCEYTTTLFHQKVKIAVFGKKGGTIAHKEFMPCAAPSPLIRRAAHHGRRVSIEREALV